MTPRVDFVFEGTLLVGCCPCFGLFNFFGTVVVVAVFAGGGLLIVALIGPYFSAYDALDAAMMDDGFPGFPTTLFGFVDPYAFSRDDDALVLAVAVLIFPRSGSAGIAAAFLLLLPDVLGIDFLS